MAAISLEGRYDRQECDNRRRRAALRDSVEAAPVRLLRQGDFIHQSSGRLRFSTGTLPDDDAAAVGRINEMLRSKGVEKQLTPEEVYITYAEAANNRFIGDRYMFLHESTLRNIASGADHGFAFMNSHRTGGLSEATELPYGQTFSGRYEEHDLEGSTFRRALVGVYMLKGIRPNGANGPSTDDIYAGIEGGTLKDVSMGLSGGSRICDVCGVDLEARDEKGRYQCPHAPGTDEDMDEGQIEGQKARGVGKGYASYSLADAYPQEVSAVFKGAVPGAGFRKSLALAAADPGFARRRGREVVLAYGPMLTPRERTQFGGAGIMDVMQLFRGWKDAGEPDVKGVELAIVERPTAPASPPTRRDEPTVHAPEPEGLTDRERRAILREAGLDAREYLGGLAGKLSPFEVNNLGLLYMLCALDDAERPARMPFDVKGPDGAVSLAAGAPVKRVDLLKAANEHRGAAPLMPTGGPGTPTGDLVGSTPLLRPGETALAPIPDGPDPKAAAQDRLFFNLAGSPAGQVILRGTPEGLAYLAKYEKARRF